MASVYKNKAGFTLVEVMVAMFILLVGMLALLNTAAVVIDHNLQNIIRDDATNVVGQSMTVFKNTPFTGLTLGTFGSTPGSASPSIITRTIRGVSVNYSVSTVIAQPDPTNANTLTIRVTAQWTHKGNTYQRSGMTVVNNVI